ncbi:MAG: copper chaperone PCu(A)C [Mariprofundaceae bacterium]
MLRSLWIIISMLVLSTYAHAELMVDHAWVRMPPPVADTAAAYFELSNHGDEDVVIESMTSNVSDKAEIHDMKMHQGMMHMKKVEYPTIPAHGALKLEPGGKHLMLMGLNKSLESDTKIILTLIYTDGRRQDVVAAVRDVRQSAPPANHAHHH